MTPVALIILAALVAGVVCGAFVLGSGRRRTAKSAEPSCGACRYSVVGLASLACPECGGDLRRVGIQAPGTPPDGSRAAMVVLIVLLGAWAGLLFFRVASDMLPRRSTLERTTTLQTPHLAPYGGAAIVVDAEVWNGRPPRIRSRVSLMSPVAGAAAVGPSPFEVDVLGGGYAYQTAAGQRTEAAAGLDADAVLGWLKGAGLDAADPLVREEAATIAIEARRGGSLRVYAEAPPLRGHSSSGSQSSTLGATPRALSSREKSGVAVPTSLTAAAAVVVTVAAAAAMAWLIRQTRPLPASIDGPAAPANANATGPAPSPPPS